MEDISICIKGTNPDLVAASIDSIRKHQDRDYEICVASEKDSVINVCKDKDVKYVRTEEREDGDFAIKQNASVDLATNKWVWIWDDDHLATKDFNPDGIKPDERIVYSNLLIEPGNRPVSPHLIHFNAGKDLESYDEEKLDDFLGYLPEEEGITFREVNYPVLLTKDAYESVGGVDELFNRAYANDPDLWYRLHNEGYNFVRVIGWPMYHFQGMTNIDKASQEEKKRRQTEELCNQDFVRKWGEIFNYSFGGAVNPGVKYHRGQEGYKPVVGYINMDSGIPKDALISLEPFFDKIILFSVSKNFKQQMKGFVNQWMDNLKKHSAMPDEYFDDKITLKTIRTNPTRFFDKDKQEGYVKYYYDGNNERLMKFRSELYGRRD